MNKTRQALIRIELIDDEVSSEWHGEMNDLCSLLGQCMEKAVREYPVMRRPMRRVMRKALRPAWLEGAAWYAVGVVLLFGVIALVGNGIVLLAKAVGLW